MPFLPLDGCVRRAAPARPLTHMPARPPARLQAIAFASSCAEMVSGASAGLSARLASLLHVEPGAVLLSLVPPGQHASAIVFKELAALGTGAPTLMMQVSAVRVPCVRGEVAQCTGGGTPRRTCPWLPLVCWAAAPAVLPRTTRPGGGGVGVLYARGALCRGLTSCTRVSSVKQARR